MSRPLYFTQEEPPRIHNLVKLCEMCVSVDASFAGILAHCSDLNPFVAAGTRYPDELIVDEAMAKAALSKADAVYNFCLSKIPELQLK